MLDKHVAKAKNVMSKFYLRHIHTNTTHIVQYQAVTWTTQLDVE